MALIQVHGGRCGTHAIGISVLKMVTDDFIHLQKDFCLDDAIIGIFVAGFFIGAANNGIIPEAVDSFIVLGVSVFMLWLGYFSV